MAHHIAGSTMAGSLNREVSSHFEKLEQQGRICAEYVWIGGSGEDIRCKTKCLEGPVWDPAELPVWNFDGSSTGQAPGHDSEIFIKPEAIFRDPFRRGDNIIVLCDTFLPDMTPVSHCVDAFGISGNNTRHAAKTIFEAPGVKEQEPWYGIEQEYTLLQLDKVTPLGFPVGGFPAPQGQYYCSCGADNSFGRDIADAHLKACLYAGVNVSGTNGEVMPGQWEYQVGPCEGIAAGDHLWMSRYLMHRVCEKFAVICTFHPKPRMGDWNGAGAHCNYSTKDMRDPALAFTYTPPQGPYAGRELKGGFAKIIEALEKMGAPGKPQEHISLYGPHNEMRLTGKHETADMNTWNYGVANRGASVRIPRETVRNGYGYLEDRRPASNMDPYVVTSKIAHTTLLC